MDITEATPITLDDKVFSTAEILAAAGLLGTDETTLGSCIKAGSLSIEDLYNPQTKISLNQQDLIHAAFGKVTQNPLLSLLVGQRLHLTSYGIVGFAMLSSATLQEALEIASTYGLLMNLKLGLNLHLHGGRAQLSLFDRYGLVAPEKKFWLYLEISKLLTLLQDILGKDFAPEHIDISLVGSPEEAEGISRILGVTVRLNCTETRLVFAEEWIERKLPQSNSITHSSCKLACQVQLKEIIQKYDLSYQVQNLLLNSNNNMPSLSDIADRLHLSPRTLRRRLDALGTSYNLLLVEVRKKLAIRYLLSTPMTTEAISEHLNYSDAANFRHAFKRWTGRSPREYRALNRGAEQSASFIYGKSYSSNHSVAAFSLG
ncbi:AraC family transcriptional regulator ligand-binding domain-containing protein [Pseudomonas farris]